VKTKINRLGFDGVWHPKRGAPFGNRNAVKTGAHCAPVRAWRKRVADWRKRTKAALAKAQTALARPPESRNPAGRGSEKPYPQPEGFPSHSWKMLPYQRLPVDGPARL